MRIDATEIGRTFGRQTRAYAEYRIFASAARAGAPVRQVAISLIPDARGLGVACSLVVGLESGKAVRITARGRHAYDAINRAALRLGRVLRQESGDVPEAGDAGGRGEPSR